MTVKDILDFSSAIGKDNLKLRVLAGMEGKGGERNIFTAEINRPGLALTGFFDNFGSKRVQLFGRGENSYLAYLDIDTLRKNVGKLMQEEVPCVVFSHNVEPPSFLAELANQYQCPLLKTSLSTSEFSIRFIRFMEAILAPRKLLHAVCVEVFGAGVLIMGDSGAGKSETALELIERGHRLVADDVVEVYAMYGGRGLLARGRNPDVAHFMEIRGLGIVNIPHLFGIGAVRNVKQIQLIVELESWDKQKEYERVGAEEKTRKILGVLLPYVKIPVKPGRNLSIIIEVAAMNERLKSMEYNAARELDRIVKKQMEQPENMKQKEILIKKLKDIDENAV